MIYQISIRLLQKKEDSEANIMAELQIFHDGCYRFAWCFLAHRRLILSALLSLFLSHLFLSPSAFLVHIHSLPPAHTHIRTHRWHKKTAFWWINLYILEPIPVSASILQRPCLLLSRVPLQPSGVISLLAVLNSLIICVLHKKRTIPQWHTTACSAWLGLALMCIGCCVVSAL